ncbi:hypothetical protein RRG08_017512, partial [Elysia crispata]
IGFPRSDGRKLFSTRKECWDIYRVDSPGTNQNTPSFRACLMALFGIKLAGNLEISSQ